MAGTSRLKSYREGSGVDPWIGRSLEERYFVVERLGAGSAGRVYRAIESPGGREVALKILEEPDGDDAAFREAFEARTAAIFGLEHPNIASIFDFGRVGDGTYYVAMERLEGRTLEELLREKGALSMASLQPIAIQLARAIAAAHDHGLVHRDLKPSNVFLVSDGGEEQVKLLDFGIAEPAMPSAAEASGVFHGSPAYIAPGQARGEGPDPLDDVYSLGVILYEMACGRPPFEAPSAIGVILQHLDEVPKPPRMIDRRIPPALEVAILRALEKERPRRFRSMDELVAALEAIGGETRPEETAPDRRPRARGKGWIWAALLASSVAALAWLRSLASLRAAVGE